MYSPTEKPIEKPEPQIIERIIEKEVILQKPRTKPRTVKPKPDIQETPVETQSPTDYTNIPEEIIQKEIRKKQVTALELKRMKKKTWIN